MCIRDSLHFCENQAVDSVFGYYSALAKRENIPFHALVSLPADLSIDEIDLCLVFSNLLENALQASVKTEPARRKINVEVYPHHNHLLLIHVENTFDGKIQMCIRDRCRWAFFMPARRWLRKWHPESRAPPLRSAAIPQSSPKHWKV